MGRQVGTGDYERAERMLPHHRRHLVTGEVDRPRWLTGSESFWYRTTRPEVVEYRMADPVARTLSPAFDTERLAAGLGRASGLTVDGVAARAGVHRATVYRRWRDVGGMLADTLSAARQTPWEPPDTGALETDLIAINRELHTALSGGSPITLALIGASFRSAEAASALREFWADRLRRGGAVVRRAALRGEIRDGTDPYQVIVAATAPLYHSVILLGDAMPPAAAEDYARIAARAFRR